MSSIEDRNALFDRMVLAIRRELGRGGAPQHLALRELRAAADALFEAGVDMPRNSGRHPPKFNPSDEMAVLQAAADRFQSSLDEAGETLRLSPETAQVSALVSSSLNVARWDNAQAAIAEANAAYNTQLFELQVEFKNFHQVKIVEGLRLNWRTGAPLAAGGQLQISNTPFPSPQSNEVNPLAPAGLVGTVILPTQGEFVISWSQLGIPGSPLDLGGRQLKPLGPPKPNYYLRVVPLMATLPAIPAAEPSNVLEAYYIIPPPPSVKVVPPEPSEAASGFGKPLQLRVDFDCLGCYETNEVTDEPYLVATGFSNKKGSWQNWWPKPLFTGVKGTSGNWCPVAMTPIGPHEQAVVVTEDEIIGFHVALCEQDNSDTEQVRKVWGSLGQLSAGAIVLFLTEDKDVAKLAAFFGSKVGDIVGELLEYVDPDDLIGERTVSWSYDELSTAFWKSWESALKSVHEDLQGFSKPWLHPDYRQWLTVGPPHLDFEGDDAKYRLYFTAKILNPYYVGPYHI